MAQQTCIIFNWDRMANTIFRVFHMSIYPTRPEWTFTTKTMVLTVPLHTKPQFRQFMTWEKKTYKNLFVHFNVSRGSNLHGINQYLLINFVTYYFFSLVNLVKDIQDSVIRIPLKKQVNYYYIHHTNPSHSYHNSLQIINKLWRNKIQQNTFLTSFPGLPLPSPPNIMWGKKWGLVTFFCEQPHIPVHGHNARCSDIMALGPPASVDLELLNSLQRKLKHKTSVHLLQACASIFWHRATKCKYFLRALSGTSWVASIFWVFLVLVQSEILYRNMVLW